MTGERERVIRKLVEENQDKPQDRWYIATVDLLEILDGQHSLTDSIRAECDRLRTLAAAREAEIERMREADAVMHKLYEQSQEEARLGRCAMEGREQIKEVYHKVYEECKAQRERADRLEMEALELRNQVAVLREAALHEKAKRQSKAQP